YATLGRDACGPTTHSGCRHGRAGRGDPCSPSFHLPSNAYGNAAQARAAGLLRITSGASRDGSGGSANIYAGADKARSTRGPLPRARGTRPPAVGEPRPRGREPRTPVPAAGAQETHGPRRAPAAATPA